MVSNIKNNKNIEIAHQKHVISEQNQKLKPFIEMYRQKYLSKPLEQREEWLQKKESPEGGGAATNIDLFEGSKTIFNLDRFE